jgi:hypothetical protein
MTPYNKYTFNNNPENKPLTHVEVGEILSDPLLVLGVDKLKVCFPVTTILARPEDWASCKEEMGGLRPNAVVGQQWVPLGNHGFSTGISTKNGQLGWVEFNPSKIVNEDAKLIGLTRSAQVLVDVLEQTRDLYEIHADLNEFAIHRLDLTVDFAPVADMQYLLDLATKASPFRSVAPSIRQHPKTGEKESVTHATKSTSCVICYDKSKKENFKTPTFRIEVQAKRDDLREMGLASIADICEEKARNVFNKRAQPFIDLCTSTPKTWIDEIVTSKEDKNTFIYSAGYEYVEMNGRKLAMTPHQRRKYRKFQKKWPHRKIQDLL